MSKFELALRGYRLTTAEILYHMPDHPSVLQSFIWQELDIAPKFPVLTKFLQLLGDEPRRQAAFGARGGARPDLPAELRLYGHEFTLH